MKRIVINEMRAYAAKMRQNGVEVKLTANRRFAGWYKYHFVAVAYDPKTKSDRYMVTRN